MLYNKIIFSAPEKYLEGSPEYPELTKNKIPDWFKKLDHTIINNTVKGCVPFLDTLTSGYLLKLPQDYLLNHDIYNKEKSFLKPAMANNSDIALDLKKYKINLDFNNVTLHPTKQLKNSPILEKNGFNDIYKILNPWKIKTPNGYSCLFVSPLNNEIEDKFTIIPAIVDTDSYDMEINFPFYANSEKYKSFETILKKGTPYVQVIPFKRDSWKMYIKSEEIKPFTNFDFYSNILHRYKNKYWNKKTWK